jgi:hypothetical protein
MTAVAGGIRRSHDDLLNRSSVEVTDQQVAEGLTEWREEAARHPGEPVVTYHSLDRHSSWPMEIAVLLEEPVDEVDPQMAHFAGTPLTPKIHIASKRGEMMLFEGKGRAICPGRPQATASFQTYEPSLRSGPRVAEFQIAFGAAAVEQWLADNHDTLGLGLGLTHYYRAASILGFPVPASEVILEEVEKRKLIVVQHLVQLAVKQRGLEERIQRVYESIGAGIQATGGGQILQMAPESSGEAGLRTIREREGKDTNNQLIANLKKELAELNADPSWVNSVIVELLGLRL